MNYNDYELNSLKYKYALKYDKRTYFQYYFSLLRMKHIIIFTFFTSNDYNSFVIKICLFLQLFIKFIKIMENLIFFIKFHKYFILL